MDRAPVSQTGFIGVQFPFVFGLVHIEPDHFSFLAIIFETYRGKSLY